MSDTKNTPEEIGAAANEYEEIFAKLASEDEVSAEAPGADAPSDPIAVDTEAELAEEPSLTEDATEAEPTGESILPEDATDTNTEAAPSSEQLSIAESSEPVDIDEVEVTATLAELKPAIEAVLFVADEPVPFNHLCKVLGEVNSSDVYATLVELMGDYEARNSGLELREIAGGWRIMTRPQHHEFIRKYLKSKPSARLSLPALETLAVIAYKQPVTVPEILEIRGVTSSSAIKTLLEKRLIITKGRKETVGRPMMYGTSKEFLMQFGLRDLNELPSMEDFEELAS